MPETAIAEPNSDQLTPYIDKTMTDRVETMLPTRHIEGHVRHGSWEVC